MSQSSIARFLRPRLAASFAHWRSDWEGELLVDATRKVERERWAAVLMKEEREKSELEAEMAKLEAEKAQIKAKLEEQLMTEKQLYINTSRK